MKTKLLKKARKRVKLINPLGEEAQSNHKRITIHVYNTDGTITKLLTNRGKTVYINYGNAVRRSRDEILKLAIELEAKSKIWHVFH